MARKLENAIRGIHGFMAFRPMRTRLRKAVLASILFEATRRPGPAPGFGGDGATQKLASEPSSVSADDWGGCRESRYVVASCLDAPSPSRRRHAEGVAFVVTPFRFVRMRRLLRADAEVSRGICPPGSVLVVVAFVFACVASRARSTEPHPTCRGDACGAVGTVLQSSLNFGPSYLADATEASAAMLRERARGVPELRDVVAQMTLTPRIRLELVTSPSCAPAVADRRLVALATQSQCALRLTNLGTEWCDVGILTSERGESSLFYETSLVAGSTQSFDVSFVPPLGSTLFVAVGVCETDHKKGARLSGLRGLQGARGTGRLIGEILESQLEHTELGGAQMLTESALVVDVIGAGVVPAPRPPLLERIVGAVGRHYHPATRVLLFVVRADGLTAIVLDSHGVRAAQRIEGGWGAVESDLRQLHAAMKLDEATAARAPRAPKEVARGVRSAPKAAFMDRAMASRALSQRVLPPAIAEALDDAKHVIIVPVHGLGAIPWPMLPMGDAEIVDRFSLSISPGVLALAHAPEPWKAGFAHALIVGDPADADVPGWHFPRLRGAEAEARTVATALGAKPLIGNAATYNSVVEASATADLLYFAAHGVSSAERPMIESFLALGHNPWTAADILSGSFPKARLAVLSACQTGLGSFHPGGVIGLARSFLHSGVPRVVMSLWSVDDDATKDLMSHFVSSLAKEPPAAALRQAMLAIRAVQPDPSKWASFAVFGDP